MSVESPQPAPASKRIRYLDSCRGLVIILMVAGHYKPIQSPEIWKVANELIHTFRMPSLFFLSGYLFFVELTRNREAGMAALVKKKAARLLIPCLTIAAAYIVVKLILPFFMRIDAPLTEDTLLNIIRDPVRSHMPIIWFLQALFIVFTLFLFFHLKLGLSPIVIYVLSIFPTFFQFPQYFSFDGAIKFMQFFILGYLVNQHSLDKRINRKYLFIAVPIFAVNAVFLIANHGSAILNLIAGYSGLVSMFFIAMLLSQSNHWLPRLIEKAGTHSMGIYILHPYIIGAVAVLCYRVYSLPANMFFLGLATAVLLGVVISALIEEYILRRYSFTRKYVLGLSR